MAGRRKAEPSWVDELFDLLTRAPVWVGPVVAGVVFVVFRWAVPGLLSVTVGGSEFGDTLGGTLSMLISRAAPLAAGAVVAIWLAAEIWKLVARISERIRKARATRSEAPPRHVQPEPTSPAAAVECPDCGATMVRRVAKTGPHAGAAFMGCPRYPACRGIRQLG